MGNVFGFIMGCLLLVGVGSIFISTSPRERLERACAPVGWMGKVATSVSMLTTTSEETPLATQRWFDSLNYSCQYTLWRQFYEESWKAEQARQQQEQDRLANEAQRHAAPAPTRRMNNTPGDGSPTP
jgi:hypothetical protein